MNARTTLDIRDLVGIGILDAVFVAVFWTCGMILGPNPLTFPFLTVVTAIPCGIVIMLLLARSPKRGTLAITGLVGALLGRAVLRRHFVKAGVV